MTKPEKYFVIFLLSLLIVAATVTMVDKYTHDDPKLLSVKVSLIEPDLEYDVGNYVEGILVDKTSTVDCSEGAYTYYVDADGYNYGMFRLLLDRVSATISVAGDSEFDHVERPYLDLFTINENKGFKHYRIQLRLGGHIRYVRIAIDSGKASECRYSIRYLLSEKPLYNMGSERWIVMKTGE